MSVATASVLITGAAQRVGRAIALDLAADGWQIAIHYHRSHGPAQTLCEEIAANGGRAIAIGADLSDTDAAPRLIARSLAGLGRLDAVVSSASLFEPDTALDFTDDGWAMHMDVNLKAPLRLAQAFAHTLPQDTQGAVINIVDQRVFKPTPQFFTYTLSKLALWQATATLAQALAPNIRVNAIAPGPTLRNARQSTEDFEKQVEATPLGTGSPVKEICRGVRYLLEASAVTGQTIAIDGGQHLIWQTPDVVGISE